MPLIGEWFSFKPTITTAGSGYVVGEKITLNTSRQIVRKE